MKIEIKWSGRQWLEDKSGYLYSLKFKGHSLGTVQLYERFANIGVKGNPLYWDAFAYVYTDTNKANRRQCKTLKEAKKWVEQQLASTSTEETK